MASNWYDDIFATRKNNWAQGATKSAQDLLSRDLGEFKGYATMSKDSASDLANKIYPQVNDSYQPGNPWYDMNTPLGESSLETMPYNPSVDSGKLETMPYNPAETETFPFMTDDKVDEIELPENVKNMKELYDKYKKKTDTVTNTIDTDKYDAGKTVVDDLMSNPSSTEKIMDVIAMVESSNTHLEKDGTLRESPDGALGKYQIMPKTAAKPGYGVKPIKNLRTASEAEHKRFSREYFTAMLKQFGGDKEKAYAAYNWGVGKMIAAEKAPGELWRQALPRETKDYLKKIEKYGGM